MKIITMHAAKTNLSRFVEEARAGADIVIARGKEPLVRLVPIDQPTPTRKFGAMRGQIDLPASFFEPLPDDELDAWDKASGK
ncbi:MAG: type II toxin-antitoxin system prevent-host-death family antitoxin [Gemmatimonadaceae bacterium]